MNSGLSAGSPWVGSGGRKFGSKSGRLAIARNLPRAGLHQDADGALGAHLGHAVRQGLLERRLHLEVEREPERLAGLLGVAQAGVEHLLDAGGADHLGGLHALAAVAGAAEDVGGERAVRVEPRLARAEHEAGLAEIVDELALLGGDRALDPEEAAAVAEAGEQVVGVEVGEDLGERGGGAGGVDHLARLGVERGGDDVGREHRAVAVDDLGALGEDRRRAGAGARLDRQRGGEQRHAPGDHREGEDEADPEQEQPGLGAGALGPLRGGEAGGALLGLDEVRIAAFGAGGEDAGERAERASDHGSVPAAAGRSSVSSGSGSGGKGTIAVSPNCAGSSGTRPSASALASTRARSLSGRFR